MLLLLLLFLSCILRLSCIIPSSLSDVVYCVVNSPEALLTGRSATI